MFISRVKHWVIETTEMETVDKIERHCICNWYLVSQKVCLVFVIIQIHNHIYVIASAIPFLLQGSNGTDLLCMCDWNISR